MDKYDLAYKRQLLARHVLFGALGAAEIDRILALGRERRVDDGRVLFKKGEPGSSMMAVLRGRVRISTYSEDGREVILNIIEPGGVVGEMALLDGKERSADATAMGDGALLVIERRDFLPFLERNPQITVRLLEVLCDRVRRSSAMVEDIVFLNLPGRLSRLLLKLAELHGKDAPGGGGRRIDLKLSQRDLGNLIATSRESVNKQLRAWQDEGLITFERGVITLRAPKKMKALADEAGG
ncbi:MAG TPA: Crp/Fnr family transcriptional regulator [Geminicoccaceae bacterium]|nr:Crp/Fnr family transcriptional regulator [Geminicoccaceae bacterium]